MKDSFIFEGKKYISSRRASQISDYASDYIGQLCRANKLDCRMIGRSWFVTEESIHLHKAAISREESGRNRIENLRGKNDADKDLSNKIVESPNSNSLASSIDINNTGSIKLDSSNTSKQVLLAPYTSSEIKLNENIVPITSTPWTVDKSSIKSPYVYSNDDRPLLPTLNKKVSDKNFDNKPQSLENKNSLILSPIIVSDLNKKNPSQEISNISELSQKSKQIKPIAKSSFVAEVKKQNINSQKILSYQKLAREIILQRVLVPAFMFVLLFGVGTGTYMFAEKVSSSITPEFAKATKVATANIVDSLSSAYSSIKGGYKNVVAFFTSPAKLAMNVPKEFGDVTVKEVTPNGIVLAPSEDSVDADNALKQKIRNSFSDDVEINPDNSGTAGVITPVFKDTKGKDFIYVMVPVKDSENKNSK